MSYLMTNHENLKRNPIAKRFQFNMCNRKTGESVSHDLAELRRIDSMLRDCLVCGISHNFMQQMLSEAANLSLQKAMDVSLSLESGIKQVAVIQNEFKQPNEVVS